MRRLSSIRSRGGRRLSRRSRAATWNDAACQLHQPVTFVTRRGSCRSSVLRQVDGPVGLFQRILIFCLLVERQRQTQHDYRVWLGGVSIDGLAKVALRLGIFVLI